MDQSPPIPQPGQHLGLASTPAFADSDTYRRFHEALEANPQFSVYADTIAERFVRAKPSSRGRVPRI
jgi:hypothetical protein